MRGIVGATAGVLLAAAAWACLGLLLGGHPWPLLGAYLATGVAVGLVLGLTAHKAGGTQPRAPDAATFLQGAGLVLLLLAAAALYFAWPARLVLARLPGRVMGKRAGETTAELRVVNRRTGKGSSTFTTTTAYCYEVGGKEYAGSDVLGDDEAGVQVNYDPARPEVHYAGDVRGRAGFMLPAAVVAGLGTALAVLGALVGAARSGAWERLLAFALMAAASVTLAVWLGETHLKEALAKNANMAKRHAGEKARGGNSPTNNPRK